jgi:hypothetical protein
MGIHNRIRPLSLLEMDEILAIVPFLMKPGAIAAAFLGLSFFVLAILRARRLPQCFSCGAMKVRLSRPSGIGDYLLGLLLIRPHRCEGCRERFYAMRLNNGLNRRAPHFVGQRRAVALVFRRRDGVLDRMRIRMVHLDRAHRRLEPENSNPGSLSGGPAVLQV